MPPPEQPHYAALNHQVGAGKRVPTILTPFLPFRLIGGSTRQPVAPLASHAS